MVANDRNSVPFAEVFRWAAAGTMGVLLVLTGAYGLYRVRDIVVLAVIALFLAISIEPVVRFMTRKGLHRLTAITLVFVVLVGLAVAFIWSLVPPITDQGGQLN